VPEGAQLDPKKNDMNLTLAGKPLIFLARIGLAGAIRLSVVHNRAEYAGGDRT
jgi:hypothetical protein